MTMRIRRASPNYGRYLFGTSRDELEEIAIFEIGGLGIGDGKGAPIIDALAMRKAKRVIYRGIDDLACPFTFGMTPVNPNVYRSRSQQMLCDYQPKKDVMNKLVIRWSGEDVPYPFSNNSFDEFHSHMVTASLVTPEHDPYKPTPETFVGEVDRLLRPGGRVFLSTDRGHFFPRWSEYGGDRKGELADRLIQSFITQGYFLNELDANEDLHEKLKDKDYGVPIKEAGFRQIMPFTYINGDIEFILIATKHS